MNIEGAVKLGYRKELMSIEDPEERAREFDREWLGPMSQQKLLTQRREGGIDDVIDPAETRSWIADSLKRVPLFRVGKTKSILLWIPGSDLSKKISIFSKSSLAFYPVAVLGSE